MEDKRGEEHIKLSTDYGGKTQLNLGHNVDAIRKLRGKGLNCVPIRGEGSARERDIHYCGQPA